MLIRKPSSIVFNAMIDPDQTTNFWFTKSSGKLEAGKTVTWTWEMYNVSTEVEVKEIIENEKIVFKWNERTVEFIFKSLSNGFTYVVVTESGYKETGSALLGAIKDSTGGFTTVLDGMKAFLEHGINLNLIADKFPKEAIQHGN
ncbi:polyketide cyclase [Solitalea longa]|uniref:Polyketide cyclase n=2 Tax=Solitalea longa TaxID=2079460 RepID=A0A2S5AAV2_9SPHI|nr:polyketide cyclase [Solitalea longa]